MHLTLLTSIKYKPIRHNFLQTTLCKKQLYIA